MTSACSGVIFAALRASGDGLEVLGVAENLPVVAFVVQRSSAPASRTTSVSFSSLTDLSTTMTPFLVRPSKADCMAFRAHVAAVLGGRRGGSR